MRPRSLAAVAFLFAGCATTPDTADPGVRESWKGATYDEVVSSWGVPVRNTKLSDGREAYTWVSETLVPRGVLWPSLGIFGGSGGFGIGTGVTIGPGGGELQRCERTLFFQNARVVDQTWQGPAEFCSTFRK
jgi:hypothetical protein